MASKIYDIESKVFIEYVKNSDTFTEILRKCGLENKGGNINTVKNLIIEKLALGRFLKRERKNEAF